MFPQGLDIATDLLCSSDWPDPDDSPANNHVLFPSSLSSPGQATGNSTVPFLTTPFLGHTADRVSCVVNWDGTLSADD